ncbi:MAG TPA: amidohydrolase [Propionibacteriaceae bacterium]|jgi:amidohydrolase|nr:amidohydrolase [Propionibacteriaceae bacterium]
MPVADTDAARRAEISHLADALNERLIAIRRDIHAHPEIGHHEHRTTALIVDELERAGLVAKVLPIGTGAYCDVLPGGYDDSSGLLGLRADIDALPIPDGKNVDYASRNPGVCHACGHDVHTAILIGVGIMLSRLRDLDLLPRGVRLIFQPAEEGSPGGALHAIEGGVLHDLTEIYALHCDPRTDVGQVALKVGPITSAVDQVNITLKGTGGHTSRPQLTQDVIGALGALATMTQLLLSRRIDPRSGVSLMWGSMHSGSVANAIPRTGEIVGTLRALDAAGWQLAKQLVPELAADIVRPFGVEVDVAVTDGVPPAVNHARGVRRLTRAAEEMLGPDAVTTTEQSLGGEDFSWMLQQVPGALARLGVRTPGEICPDIHQPTFVVDEACIPVGLKLLTEVATTFERAAI